MSFLRRVALPALLSACCCLLLSASVSGQAPTIALHTPQPLNLQRNYPYCVVDVHAIKSFNTSVNTWQFGGANSAFSNGPYQTYDYTRTGVFDPRVARLQATASFTFNISAYSPSNPIGRLAAGAAYLSNGNLIVFGGKIGGSFAWTNDVILSTDLGNSWSRVTTAAPWSARSDLVSAVQPGTNNVVLLGGANNNNGADFNDVWLSTDGQGLTWTQVNPNAFSIADAEMTWLPDTGNGTIVLYDYANNQVYQSLTMGATWVSVANLATIAATQPGSIIPQATGSMIADGNSNLYLVGGAGSPVVWFSSNKGVAWTYLPQPNATIPGIQSLVTLTRFSYGCLSIQYSASTVAPSGFHRNLVLYGGFLTASIDFSVSGSAACPAASTAYQSLLLDVVFPSEASTAGADLSIPPTNVAASVAFHDSAKPANLFTPFYPTCAYDVHALANRSSGTSPRMWQLGGFSNDYLTMYNRVSFTQNSFASVAAYYPSYAGNSSVVSGRVAGGAALLYNGALLWFGGKVSGGIANDVYYSSNNGQSFTLSTANAQWSARSDMSTIAFPLTSIVMLVGGAGTVPVNDVWVSTDGTGAAWTQKTSIPSTGGFIDTASVALFDSSAFPGGNSGQTYSTVLVAPSDTTSTTSSIFASTDLGATWTVIAAQPWSYRSRNDMTADLDNYVYASGGVADGNVYFSWNKGVSWSTLQQQSTSAIWSNTVIYGFSQNNCQFMSYSPNANSPNGYHKTLIIYGGGTAVANQGAITVSNPRSNCANNSDATVVFGELLLPCEVACGFNGTCPAGVSCLAAAPGVSSSSAGASGGASGVLTAASTGSVVIAASSSSGPRAVAASSSSSSSSRSSSGSSIASSSSSSSSSSGVAPATNASSLSSPSSSSSSSTGVADGPIVTGDAPRTAASTLSVLAAAVCIALAAAMAA